MQLAVPSVGQDETADRLLGSPESSEFGRPGIIEVGKLGGVAFGTECVDALATRLAYAVGLTRDIQ